MAHLVVTVLIVAGYLYTVAIGHPDTTLQNLLLLTGGYWFGQMARNAVSGKGTSNDQQKQDDSSKGGQI